MSLIANGAGESAKSFYNGVITSSCRFNGTSSKLVSPAFASDLGNTWTWSAWVKFTNQTSDRRGTLFNAVGESAALYFDNTSQDFLSVNDDGAAVRSTSRVLRDPSSWYHIVLNGNGTLNKLWINGVLATFNTNPNVDGINIAVAHQIGDSAFGANYFFDGIMADINFVSQTALDYTAFAETKNGVLIPKEPSVTYGANGFRLQFKQTGSGADASGIGADTSGNNKHFTATGLDAYDVLPDSPENNFSTWNALFKGGEASSSIATNPSLSEGNLQVSLAGNSYIGNTFRPISGKWYCEIRVKTIGNTNGEIDWGWLQATTYAGTTGHSGQANKWGAYYHAYSTDHIQVYDETSQLGSNINLTISAGDVLQLAWDIDNNKGWVGINDTYYAADNGTDGNPSAGTNQTFTFTDDEAQNLQCYIANGTGTDVHVANFGQDSTFGGDETATTNADANGIGAFHHAPPSGFLALCSANLPEPTIGPNSATQADDYFNTVLYTGNATDDTAIAVDFQPDWTWIKKRSDAQEHVLFDSNRGATKRLFSNLTNAESDSAASLKAFTSTGFTLGTDSNVNDNTETFVAWNWKANGGTTSSNTDGSITSTVQANTTAGFSIVTYTGTGASATVGHGLGVAPTMIIFKNRSNTNNWTVYNKDNGNTNAVFLNLTNANSTSSTFINSTTPSSTIFNLLNVSNSNGGNNSIIAYCFHDVEGYSKFGSYTGNGNADGAFVHLGFRPAFVLLKRTDATGHWVLMDSVSDPNNPIDSALLPSDSSGAGTGYTVDFLSNGFKLRLTGTAMNASGATHIYMAFAEAPFKFANAR